MSLALLDAVLTVTAHFHKLDPSMSERGFFSSEQRRCFSELCQNSWRGHRWVWKWALNLGSPEGGLGRFCECPENLCKLAYLCRCAFTLWRPSGGEGGGCL